jgi:hypothetical protein
MTARRTGKAFVLAALIAVAVVPAALAAKGGNGKGKGQGKPHGVAYVFKGTYAGDSMVVVNHGNRHVKRAGYVGETVSFDLSEATVVVDDTNGDLVADLGDVAVDDRVLVRARLPRKDPPAQPLAARKLVDQTSPPSDDGEETPDPD